jgi:hypothetical protein
MNDYRTAKKRKECDDAMSAMGRNVGEADGAATKCDGIIHNS